MYGRNHWNEEEKAAFEVWLIISIEMVEKHCTPKEAPIRHIKPDGACTQEACHSKNAGKKPYDY